MQDLQRLAGNGARGGGCTGIEIARRMAIPAATAIAACFIML